VDNIPNIAKLDFDRAKTAYGSRSLSPHEALRLLNFCCEQNWVFQSIEAFVIDGNRERLDLELSLLGLSKQEQAALPEEMYQIALNKIDSAKKDARQYIFKVWIVAADDFGEQQSK
jgi:hypothetical protein